MGFHNWAVAYPNSPKCILEFRCITRNTPPFDRAIVNYAVSTLLQETLTAPLETSASKPDRPRIAASSVTQNHGLGAHIPKIPTTRRRYGDVERTRRAHRAVSMYMRDSLRKGGDCAELLGIQSRRAF